MRSRFGAAARWWPVLPALAVALLGLWVMAELRSQTSALDTQGSEISALSGGLSTAEGQTALKRSTA